MKKNIDYYPHKREAHRHPKFRMLRSLFGSTSEGWAAEGRFWALNNLIAGSENCLLDLTKKRNKGVFADELGMSIAEFDEFIKILTSDDVELLTQIEPDIYTTDTVQETYSSTASEREKARQRRQNPVIITSSGENIESSPETSKSSPEPNNKVNESKVNEIKVNKKKVNESDDPTFLTNFHFDKIKKLYSDHTRIKDPNMELHIEPLLKFFFEVPEHLSQEHISAALEEVFEKLDPANGVRVDILCNNIQQKITAKHEEVLDNLKKPLLEEAENDRNIEALQLAETEAQLKREKATNYRKFYESHTNLFTNGEKTKILDYLKHGKIIQAGAIIEPKMETAALC